MKALTACGLILLLTMVGLSQPNKWSIVSMEVPEVVQYTRNLNFLIYHLQEAGITPERPKDFASLDAKQRKELESEMRMTQLIEKKFWNFGKQNPDALVGSEKVIWQSIDREIGSNYENSDPVTYLLRRVEFHNTLEADRKERWSANHRLSDTLRAQLKGTTPPPNFQTAATPSATDTAPPSLDLEKPYRTPPPSPSAPIQQRSFEWPWVVGIVALVVAVVLALKRRS
jgi:hypothetical protein